jgi:ornithine cyclodeaminase
MNRAMPTRSKPTSRGKVRFFSAEDVAGIVAGKGVVQCLEGMAAYIHEDFLQWDDFDKRARVATHSRDGVIELMSISDERVYALKYVNGHPGNVRHALPTVMSFGILADVRTGMPTLVSELTLTTALRTAATSVVAARALARADSRAMALIGNGAQSEFQALAFHHLMGIGDFHLFDTDGAATEKLIRNLRGVGLSPKRFANARDSVLGADIVTTLTADKTRAAILTPDMIEPGMHINAVGGDCPGKTELHPDVLRMARVFVEYEPQSRIEGDVQQMSADFPVTELWQVLAGTAEGRTAPTQVTVFDSVGFALEDYSALRFMRDMADELGISTSISLIPHLPDPKDLFGFIEGCVGDRRVRAPAVNAAENFAP